MEASGQHHAPNALPLGKELHGIHWTGGWKCPTVGMDSLEKRRITDPCREQNHNSSVVEVSHYTNRAIVCLVGL